DDTPILNRAARTAESRRYAGRARTRPRGGARLLDQCYAETEPAVARSTRWREIRDEIAATGTYTHTLHELEFGARVAWRNSARCIGRLYWKSLRVRDLRHLRAPEDVARECVTHLRESTRG